MGYQIVAVSADRPRMLRASVEQHDLDFRLLSDSSMTAAARFGLAWQAKKSMVDAYMSYGLDIEKAAGLDHHILPVPAVFLVGVDLIVRFRYYNPDHRVRLSADELLAAAREEPSDSAD